MESIINKAWENRALLAESDVQNAIEEVINDLDKGVLRVA